MPIPIIVEKCPSELWDGVECELPVGHSGPHFRGPCPEGAALSWRSSSPAFKVSPEPKPGMFKLAALAR